MLRAITKLASLAVVLLFGTMGILFYQHFTAQSREKDLLEEKNAQLARVVDRLTSERRVAEMLMTDQKVVNGIPHTTLLFVEYARNGETLPPKTFTILGDQVHLDAMVIKFDRDFVEKNDPLRGHSIALFTRIFGNHQSPDEGTMVDAAGKIPDYYKGIDPRISSFETDLWDHFWQLATDKAYREAMGVRVSDGEGKWWPCQPNQLYTITIETDGGLNVTAEPIKGIYREALRRRPQ